MSIFFLGAGFSRPARLPLGDELFSEILKYAKASGLYTRDLKSTIEDFTKYSHATTGKKLAEEEIKLEEFISYLDIENYLVLHGSHITSASGTIRNLIAAVLHQHESEIEKETFCLYEKFAEHLKPDDWIITFNYDTILERALRAKNIRYRLFPRRYKELQDTPLGSNNIIDMEAEEVVILKMHGSINWFDKSDFDKIKKRWIRYGLEGDPKHIVFDGTIDKRYIHKLVGEPYPDTDPLSNIYVLENLSQYFSQIKFLISEEPVIISPSYNKLVNLNYLRSFWNGFMQSGLYETKVVIIGFSLPPHDEYIKQPLYYFIRNFQKFDDPSIGKKSRLKIIDFKRTNKEIEEFKSNYRFVDQRNTDFYFNGFNKEAIDMIFSEE